MPAHHTHTHTHTYVTCDVEYSGLEDKVVELYGHELINTEGIVDKLAHKEWS